VRPRQRKGSAPDRLSLNHRATPRLHRCDRSAATVKVGLQCGLSTFRNALSPWRPRAGQNLEWVVSFGRQLVVSVRDNFGPRINEILVWLPGFIPVGRNKKTHRDRYRQEDTGELAVGFTHAVVCALSRQRHPRRKGLPMPRDIARFQQIGCYRCAIPS
jgi:hypothetical protein